MTKIKILFAILLMFLLGEKTYAQKDTMKISAGMTIAPQAGFNPKDLSTGGKFFTNLFPQVTVVKGKFYGVGFYSISGNNFGCAVGINPTKNTTAYLVGFKSTLTNNKYLGVGVGTPLAGGRSTGFIELGSGLKSWKPAVYMGMFIPFTRKIK